MTPSIRRIVGLASLALVGSTTASHAGPFINLSITASDPAITAWADALVDYAPALDPSPVGTELSALGPADNALVSLGDLDVAGVLAGDAPGSITLSFATPITNGSGADLAVFENAFAFFPPDDAYIFAELAFVEVSTNGVDFARFPNVSLNTEGALDPATDILIPDFGGGPLRDFVGILTSNTNGLAGIHELGLGTLFDLEELASDPLVVGGLLDLASVGFVRLVDIPGDGSVVDSLGNPMLDSFSTAAGFENAGFDLDAVGALYVVPEPGTGILLLTGLALLAARERRT